jgi:hypothetical protein
MTINKIFSVFIITMILGQTIAFAKGPEYPDGKAPVTTQTSWRNDCVRPTNQIEMQVNNVRARLLTGGDIWSTAAYIVPKPAAGQLPVSALYAGGVWIGGKDRAGNIRLSAVTYRSEGFDFFSGPLDLNGATSADVCKDWDRFFVVKGDDVRRHYNNIIKALTDPDFIYECDSIPEDVRYWPGQGNPYWREKYTFDLPDQTLGAFWDNAGDGLYDPCDGDFPLIDIRDCEPENLVKAKELIPDEMVFWIYNDNGNAQTLSGPNKIQMEVQVQSFAYSTNDEINDMTFYRYKLINKATEDLIDCYFSMWIDPDLGCYQDDYIGCDVERSLAFVYNQDAVDGSNGSSCEGTNTYGENIPVLGMDYFRGPRGPKVFKRDNDGNVILDENGNPILLEPIPNTGAQDTVVELGMTSFTYAENCGLPGSSFPPGQCDPQRGREDGFYNYIRGFWVDETPFTFGGSGYNPGSSDTVRYAFPGDPNDGAGWSMCTANLPFGDRRTLQATGPLLLQPGAQNELIVGVVFVPDVPHPCPDLTRLKFADDIAQALFDNCFDITDGPDAPDITSVELDQELILMLSNDPASSNNFDESYAEVDLQAPLNVDSLYRFEGYRIYQLANASVTAQELGDISKARQIAQVDVKNGIKEIYNWVGSTNPFGDTEPTVWTPIKTVTGADAGLRYSFRITEDQFALGNRRLINHTPYHFLVLAYAHNNWKKLDVLTGVGQKRAYLEGRGNVGGPSGGAYTFVPRPIVYEQLQAAYGDGPAITRLSGEGNPGVFLDIDDSMYEILFNGSGNGKVLYKKGAGPIDVKVVDPLRIRDGKFRLEITGNFNTARATCAFDAGALWKLTNLETNVVIFEAKPLAIVKEYIVNNYGYSLNVSLNSEAGAAGEGPNGAVGARLEYKDAGGPIWFNAYKDGGSNGTDDPITDQFSFVRSVSQDKNSSLARMGDGFFVPFLSTKWANDAENTSFYLSPAAKEIMGFMTGSSVNSLRFRDLNNVDIVFTSDKSKWSKCIVVESTEPTFDDVSTVGGRKNFELRKAPSIGKNGELLNDGTEGFSYFPGYAVDVETGKRLNIFFGESSVYRDSTFTFGDSIVNMKNFLDGDNPIGGDLIFNPSSQTVIEEFILRDPVTGELFFTNKLESFVGGGQHYIYVTRQEYDGCASFAPRLTRTSTGATASNLNRGKVGAAITWTSFPIGVSSAPLLPLDKGLIPNDLTVKLRVSNPYGSSRRYNIERERDCETDGDLPVYEFEFKNAESKQLATQDEYVGALENVNVVPNPYYAYSAYETNQFTNVVKITNLPAKATVTIYSIDGSFIRQYNRDEREAILAGGGRPTSTSQVYPDLEWDMKNFKEIPVASGVYLIHISAPEYGEERTIKWFGVGRKFDPSGL